MFNGIYAAQTEFPLFHSVKRWNNRIIVPCHLLHGALNEYGKNISNYYYDNLMDTIAQYEKMGRKSPL